jgi:hypothetical protein
MSNKFVGLLVLHHSYGLYSGNTPPSLWPMCPMSPLIIDEKNGMGLSLRSGVTVRHMSLKYAFLSLTGTAHHYRSGLFLRPIAR